MKLSERLSGIAARLRRWGLKGVCEWAVKKVRMARNRQFIVANARRHGDTMPVRGITVVGPLTQSWSMSKTLRDFVIRLRECGVPCQTFDTGVISENVAKGDFDGLLTPRGEFDARKFSVVVELHYSTFPKGLGPKCGRLCFWEAEKAFPEFSPDPASSDFFLTMSDFNHVAIGKAFEESGFPVRKVLYPLLQVPRTFLGADEVRRKYTLPEGAFVVFSNFDLGSFHRKNPLGMVRAFAAAFVDAKDAWLVFKVNHAGEFGKELAEIKSLAAELGVGERLRIISAYIPQPDIYALTNAADVYISLNRGEGFGLGIAEAMSLRKPVVITDFGAPLEFCTKDNAMLVPFSRVAIKEGEYFMKAESWPEPDVDAAAKCLRILYEDSGLRQRIGESAEKTIASHFSDESFRRSVGTMVEEFTSEEN